LENAQNAFPTAPTALALKSGQVTCQTEADRSLVNNTGHYGIDKDQVEALLQRAAARLHAVGDDLDLVAFQPERVLEFQRNAASSSTTGTFDIAASWR
jgi:hypothetical protein